PRSSSAWWALRTSARAAGSIVNTTKSYAAARWCGAVRMRRGGGEDARGAPGERGERFFAFRAVATGGPWGSSRSQGAKMAIAEVCRNLAVSGAEPIGITDCLNFGSPERPEIMDQFAKAIDGMAAACTALGVPIVSGNVSLYNETDGKSILPTPTVAA